MLLSVKTLATEIFVEHLPCLCRGAKRDPWPSGAPNFFLPFRVAVRDKAASARALRVPKQPMTVTRARRCPDKKSLASFVDAPCSNVAYTVPVLSYLTVAGCHS